MVNYWQFAAVILAGLAVAVADALIKKTSDAGNFWGAFRNPWMIAVLFLYLLQVIFFVYVFINNWQLGIVGNTQMVMYALTTVLIGLLAFGESLSLTQGAGVILALIAVWLMNT